MHQINIYFRIT